MKNKIKLYLGLLLLAVILIQSCSSTRKDCRGKTKHRLSNGIYM